MDYGTYSTAACHNGMPWSQTCYALVGDGSFPVLMTDTHYDCAVRRNRFLQKRIVLLVDGIRTLYPVYKGQICGYLLSFCRYGKSEKEQRKNKQSFHISCCIDIVFHISKVRL